MNKVLILLFANCLILNYGTVGYSSTNQNNSADQNDVVSESENFKDIKNCDTFFDHDFLLNDELNFDYDFLLNDELNNELNKLQEENRKALLELNKAKSEVLKPIVRESYDSPDKMEENTIFKKVMYLIEKNRSKSDEAVFRLGAAPNYYLQENPKTSVYWSYVNETPKSQAEYQIAVAMSNTFRCVGSNLVEALSCYTLLQKKYNHELHDPDGKLYDFVLDDLRLYVKNRLDKIKTVEDGTNFQQIHNGLIAFAKIMKLLLDGHINDYHKIESKKESQDNTRKFALQLLEFINDEDKEVLEKKWNIHKPEKQKFQEVSIIGNTDNGDNQNIKSGFCIEPLDKTIETFDKNDKAETAKSLSSKQFEKKLDEFFFCEEEYVDEVTEIMKYVDVIHNICKLDEIVENIVNNKNKNNTVEISEFLKNKITDRIPENNVMYGTCVEQKELLFILQTLLEEHVNEIGKNDTNHKGHLLEETCPECEKYFQSLLNRENCIDLANTIKKIVGEDDVTLTINNVYKKFISILIKDYLSKWNDYIVELCTNKKYEDEKEQDEHQKKAIENAILKARRERDEYYRILKLYGLNDKDDELKMIKLVSQLVSAQYDTDNNTNKNAKPNCGNDIVNLTCEKLLARRNEISADNDETILRNFEECQKYELELKKVETKWDELSKKSLNIKLLAEDKTLSNYVENTRKELIEKEQELKEKIKPLEKLREAVEINNIINCIKNQKLTNPDRLFEELAYRDEGQAKEKKIYWSNLYSPVNSAWQTVMDEVVVNGLKNGDTETSPLIKRGRRELNEILQEVNNTANKVMSFKIAKWIKCDESLSELPQFEYVRFDIQDLVKEYQLSKNGKSNALLKDANHFYELPTWYVNEAMLLHYNPVNKKCLSEFVNNKGEGIYEIRDVLLKTAEAVRKYINKRCRKIKGTKSISQIGKHDEIEFVEQKNNLDLKNNSKFYYRKQDAVYRLDLLELIKNTPDITVYFTDSLNSESVPLFKLPHGYYSTCGIKPDDNNGINIYNSADISAYLQYCADNYREVWQENFFKTVVIDDDNTWGKFASSIEKYLLDDDCWEVNGDFVDKLLTETSDNFFDNPMNEFENENYSLFNKIKHGSENNPEIVNEIEKFFEKKGWIKKIEEKFNIKCFKNKELIKENIQKATAIVMRRAIYEPILKDIVGYIVDYKNNAEMKEDLARLQNFQKKRENVN